MLCRPVRALTIAEPVSQGWLVMGLWPSAEQDGIDILLEFANEDGNGTGKGLCLQLKAGNSHLTKRKMDGAEVFLILGCDLFAKEVLCRADKFGGTEMK